MVRRRPILEVIRSQKRPELRVVESARDAAAFGPEARSSLEGAVRGELVVVRGQRLLAAMQREKGKVLSEEEVRPLVFPSETGGPLDSRNVYHRDFLPCLEAAGLRRVTWHSLRHRFGPLLIQSGASLAYVKEQMGHSSIQVTVDIYGHLVPGESIKWIDKLGSCAETEPNAEPGARIAAGSRVST
jgi:integrase